jgi:AraC family transcriptional regulator, regulatory protein of adaptative response / methylated-DNA-[protein]-cysteine methyltransferase
MKEQDQVDYLRIAAAIDFIQKHFSEQPNLDRIAEHVHMSPHHFQRMFTEWAGVSPKKFTQYLSISHAKEILKSKNSTISTVVAEVGLSGSGRLHDLFVTIEGMTPGEYKNGGVDLRIQYYFFVTQFGNILIASTTKGICYMAFCEEEQYAYNLLFQEFPNAHFVKETNDKQLNALRFFSRDWSDLQQIKLHLKGTDFQLKVWEALLKIPMGNLSTYGTIADQVGNPKASRAVGTAIGRNPIAFIIPCHRVIQASGKLGGYMWGSIRKSAIIGWEATKK